MTRVYRRYPLVNVLLYNGVTVLHYLLGALGIALGYRLTPLAWLFGSAYLAFALFQMYVLMPLTVCPGCVYCRMPGSLCTSGLNVVARRVAGPGDSSRFAGRARGIFCHNNLYMAALAIPVVALLPALVIRFSLLLLAAWLGVVGLLAFRIFVVFGRTACPHCAAKHACPNYRGKRPAAGPARTPD